MPPGTLLRLSQGRTRGMIDGIRSLTNRLPIMICPRWLATPTQPIAAADLLQYLVEANELPAGESRVFEIGGSDVVTYGELILEYARQADFVVD